MDLPVMCISHKWNHPMCVWLLSLNTMLWGFSYIVSCGRTSSYVWIIYNFTGMPLSLSPLTECFHFEELWVKLLLNISIDVLCGKIVLVFLDIYLEVWFWGSHSNSTVKILGGNYYLKLLYHFTILTEVYEGFKFWSQYLLLSCHLYIILLLLWWW